MAQKSCILDFEKFAAWNTEEKEAASTLFTPQNPGDSKRGGIWSPNNCYGTARFNTYLEQYVVKFGGNLLVAFDENDGSLLGGGTEGKVRNIVAAVEMSASNGGKATFCKAASNGKSVIKIGCCEYFGNTEEQNRFKKNGEQEASIVQQVYPLNLCGGGNYYCDDDQREGKITTYTLMEKKEGKELFDFVTDVRENEIELTKSSILDIAIQILNAMLHVHNKGVIHRDGKMENFMISYSVDGNKHPINTSVSVVDFGFAREAQKRDSRDVNGCGTVGYMPPEIFSINVQEKPFTYVSDAFSVGRVLAFLFGADDSTKQVSGDGITEQVSGDGTGQVSGDGITEQVSGDGINKNLNCSLKGTSLKFIEPRIKDLGFSDDQCKTILNILQEMMKQDPHQRLNLLGAAQRFDAMKDETLLQRDILKLVYRLTLPDANAVTADIDDATKCQEALQDVAISAVCSKAFTYDDETNEFHGILSKAFQKETDCSVLRQVRDELLAFSGKYMPGVGYSEFAPSQGATLSPTFSSSSSTTTILSSTSSPSASPSPSQSSSTPLSSNVNGLFSTATAFSQPQPHPTTPPILISPISLYDD